MKAPRKHLPFDFLRERKPTEESKDGMKKVEAKSEQRENLHKSVYKISDRRLAMKKKEGSLQKVYMDNEKDGSLRFS